MSEAKPETKECHPCKAKVLVGVGSAICKREGSDPPKCEELIGEYMQGKKTLIEVLMGFKELVSGKDSKIIDRLIADAKV